MVAASGNLRATAYCHDHGSRRRRRAEDLPIDDGPPRPIAIGHVARPILVGLAGPEDLHHERADRRDKRARVAVLVGIARVPPLEGRVELVERGLEARRARVGL